ncbi:carbamoyltransferase HypF, partial [bacterium]|nr:carbamoyltransferase HypF [bacterium]
MDTQIRNPECMRMRVAVQGVVQGVGFRPFVYRIATELGLVGWVRNSSSGVSVEVEGTQPDLEKFLVRIQVERPPISWIRSLEHSYLDAAGYSTFEIQDSEESGSKTVSILPDVATCLDCLNEIFDPANRRYLYPFTNCTNCGPRFSIIKALPYDRLNTTMRDFVMCKACRGEYEHPEDRRFHAQPNACSKCGPHLELWDENGTAIASHHQAMLVAGGAIRQGMIVAVKGLGGFHLMTDARNTQAVNRLRRLKRREEKPFALMFPNLEMIKKHCVISPTEERILNSPERPIILLRRNYVSKSSEITSQVAPANPYLGVMMPYTPLHHLLMAQLEFPVVATSGNLSDEPICINENEALTRLHGIADLFLIHNRPIARPIDDSIVREILGCEFVVRRARGYAPLSIHWKESLPSVLAVGGHLKNTIAISVGPAIFLSQHIGDLDTKEAYNAFQQAVSDFLNLYNVSPGAIVCD